VDHRRYHPGRRGRRDLTAISMSTAQARTEVTWQSRSPL